MNTSASKGQTLHPLLTLIPAAHNQIMSLLPLTTSSHPVTKTKTFYIIFYISAHESLMFTKVSHDVPQSVPQYLSASVTSITAASDEGAIEIFHFQRALLSSIFSANRPTERKQTIESKTNPSEGWPGRRWRLSLTASLSHRETLIFCLWENLGGMSRNAVALASVQ